MKFLTRYKKFYNSASPGLRRRLFLILLFLILFNLSVWIFAIISSQNFPMLLGLIILAYGFGLRHAVDADHIAAIDNATRKLMQDGAQPVGVGFFFSLGHSTIVIILSLLVAFSAAFVKQNLPSFEHIGSIIGTSISSIFLLVIGIINLIVFIDIFKIWKKVIKGGNYADRSLNDHLNNRGFLARILKPFLKNIKKSWNLYLIGLLFGLGFDTASEVGLLSISAASGASGISLYNIFLLPLAFTAGMTLIDTLDGILMLGAYGWAFIKPVRKLYYNMCITFITVILALFIGGIEALQIISGQTGITSGIFHLANKIQLENLGIITICIFLSAWLISVIVYKYHRYDLLDSKKEN